MTCEDPAKLAEFEARNQENLAVDCGGYLTYLAPSRVNLQLAEERWPESEFLEDVRERLFSESP